MTTLAYLQSQIIVKAWEDNSFRSQLVMDPKSTLLQMGGDVADVAMAIPNLKVYLDTPDTLHIVIPMNPVGIDDLSDADLDRIAEADTGPTMKDPNCATKNYTKPCSRECK